MNGIVFPPADTRSWLHQPCCSDVCRSRRDVRTGPEDKAAILAAAGEAKRDGVVDVLEGTAFEHVANGRCRTNNATKLALSSRLTTRECAPTACKIREASDGWRRTR
jgi:hypothetical protein